jgi:putative redox protein
MAERTAAAEWLGDYRVDVATGEFTLRVDEPKHVGGTDTGPQPTDLLLASIASCYVLSLVYSARKLSVDLSAVSVSVIGTYAGPRFSDIRIGVRMDASAADSQRLLESASRVCYVTNTLRRPPSINVDYEGSTTQGNPDGLGGLAGAVDP